MDNKQIAEVFEEIGDILDVQDAGFFKVNAYRKGAIAVLNYPYDLRDLVENRPQDLSKIPGIGAALSAKIIELVNTGHCKEYESLKKTIPPGLLEILKVRGLGPKKVRLFYTQLGIKDLKALKKAAEENKIRELAGMGEKSENEVLKAIQEYSLFSTKRHSISEALMEATRVISYMKQNSAVEKIEYAGSLRRCQETIGDIDILVTVKNYEKSHKDVMDHFVNYGERLEIIANGDTKSSIILTSGIQVDLRVVVNEGFGAALHYFTGSKEHNIKIRDIAKKKGLKVSEYGVFKGDKLIAGETEEEVFAAIGLPYIIPEIRRDEGEIEYGLQHHKFPKFIEVSDMRADLHAHTIYSDGKNTMEEMTLAMIERGYEYFAFTDHSSVMGVTSGMGSQDIRRQWKEIEVLKKKYGEKIRILKGSEVDILKDGSLDFSDEILKELDVVVIAAHMFNRLSAREQTKRLIAAIENPYSKILAHPSGRLINKRSPMEFDVEKIIDACVENKVVLEINSNPQRLDLEYKYVKMAKERGAKFVINTDSHSVLHLPFISFGVGVARRGWLDKDDVLNANSFHVFDTYF